MRGTQAVNMVVSPGGASFFRGSAAVGLLLLLASCAGAHVEKPVTAPDTRPVAPVAVTVKISVARTPQTAARIDRTIQVLEAGLAKGLEKANIAAYVATDGDAATHPDGNTLALVVDVSRLDRGNMWARELIGFGTGKSHFQSHVTLYDTRNARLDDLLDFTVKADSGNMPGVAVSAWNPVGLGIHGAAAIAREAASNGHEDADRTARAIIGKMVAYYRTNGWLPPENTQSD